MARSSLQVMAVLALLVVPFSVHAQKTVILVRHADRAGGSDELSDKGLKRAQALACTLRSSGITAIVRSNTNRTKATAAPTAGKLGIDPKIVIYDSSHIEEHVKKALVEIRSSGDNSVVLYVGHSDTLEPLLRELGYKGPFSLEDQYGNLFVVPPKGQGANVVWLHYSSEGGNCGDTER